MSRWQRWSMVQASALGREVVSVRLAVQALVQGRVLVLEQASARVSEQAWTQAWAQVSVRVSARASGLESAREGVPEVGARRSALEEEELVLASVGMASAEPESL